VKHIITALALMASPAVADCYLPVGIGSKHINATRDFNEFNPSLGLGCAWGGERFQYGLEGGVAYNSYSNWMTYGAAFAHARAASFESVDLWAGAFVGYAGYANLATSGGSNIPTLGDTHIMVAGLTGIAEFERVNVVLNYIPFGSKMDGVLILKLQFPIGGRR